MGILSSGGMGLDLGSANVTICLQKRRSANGARSRKTVWSFRFRKD